MRWMLRTRIILRSVGLPTILGTISGNTVIIVITVAVVEYSGAILTVVDAVSVRVLLFLAVGVNLCFDS